MGNYSKEDKIPAENFMGTIAVNVDNEKLSDKMFREMIRNTLPIVEFPRNDEERVEELKRLIPLEMDPFAQLSLQKELDNLTKY